MTAARPRFALLGAVLAFVALLGLGVLSGWHSAAFHDHAPAHAQSAEHMHERSGQGDPNSPIHMAAHSSGQWLAATGEAFFHGGVAVTRPAWTMIASVPGGSFDPSSLLRPPRA